MPGILDIVRLFANLVFLRLSYVTLVEIQNMVIIA